MAWAIGGQKGRIQSQKMNWSVITRLKQLTANSGARAPHEGGAPVWASRCGTEQNRTGVANQGTDSAGCKLGAATCGERVCVQAHSDACTPRLLYSSPLVYSLFG